MDEERVTAALNAIRDAHWSTEATVAAMDALVTAARLEERRAIVAFLRERAAVPFTTREQRDVGSIYAASLIGEADRIERGDHEAARVLGERGEAS